MEISPFHSNAPNRRASNDESVRDTALRDAAQRLEATFLAEMLKSAGLGKTDNGFDGGAGEDQFASFLVDQQALQMVRAGGIGLTEALYEALKEKENVTE